MTFVGNQDLTLSGMWLCVDTVNAAAAHVNVAYSALLIQNVVIAGKTSECKGKFIVCYQVYKGLSADFIFYPLVNVCHFNSAESM